MLLFYLLSGILVLWSTVDLCQSALSFESPLLLSGIISGISIQKIAQKHLHRVWVSDVVAVCLVVLGIWFHHVGMHAHNGMCGRKELQGAMGIFNELLAYKEAVSRYMNEGVVCSGKEDCYRARLIFPWEETVSGVGHNGTTTF